ncbi:biotin synthase, partial [Paraburkholderia sp. SIMBA_055]
ADFLLRGYGFRVDELFDTPGNLALDIDPKLAWALSHRESFPVDLNRANVRMIARVPGIGMRNAKRLVALRRSRRIRYQDLVQLR